FGKWHLGDTYPNRPSEQGFQESLVHNAGGMAQVGDPNTYFEENSYFDATLWENNQLVKTKGYCSDVFTEAAIHFIEKNKDKSFFTYLPFNAPHTPLQVPDEYYAKYKDLPLESTVFSQKGYPMPSMTDKDREDARRVYAMVENIDDNVNRLLKKLEENGLMENTLIFFLTDNGPQQRRYTAGFRGTKGTVYEGGVRVPLIVYPRQNGQERINAPTAHMDIFPTIMNICQLNFQHDIDGISLTSLFQKNTQPFAERVIYHHWTRGYFTPYQNMAIRQGDYKLVGKVDYDAGIDEFELYNIINDPFEQNNMIHSLPEEAEKLKEKLDAWINDVVRNIKADPVIVIGDHHENPTLLNRNDAKGQPGIWAQDEIYGYWDIEVATSGYYNFKYYFLHNLSGEGAIRLNLKPMEYTKQITSDTTKEITLRDIYIPAGRYRLETWYQPKNSVFILPFNIEILKKE
ncbi:MAG: sulfatase-like hydrolase/transferase, partial [Saprospiraceae bacterium]|nr:sulfatase-like hydrolase/transferase [Saprospiraceae bacterium]